MWIITKDGTAKNVRASDYREQLGKGTVRLPSRKELLQLPSTLSDEYVEEIPNFLKKIKGP